MKKIAYGGRLDQFTTFSAVVLIRIATLATTSEVNIKSFHKRLKFIIEVDIFQWVDHQMLPALILMLDHMRFLKKKRKL